MKRSSSSIEPAHLFVGTLYHAEEYFKTAKERLKGLFGEIAMESPALGWKYTEYYHAELGRPITRTFIFFRGETEPQMLPEIKLVTNDIEEQLSSGGKRNINIDPGYMTLSKVVLASTKNYSHRIYLGKGIYAEVALVYRNGRYQPHIFTYPDYASEECREIFAQARKFLMKS